MRTPNPGSEVNNDRLTVMGQHMCPDCRTIMAEADRLTEDGVSFIWYECPREGCDRQWLEKRTCEMGVA